MHGSRNFESNQFHNYEQDVEKRIMERDSMFNMNSSRSSMSDGREMGLRDAELSFSEGDFGEVGEITGMRNSGDQVTRGMPMRNFFSDSGGRAPSDELNRQLDFDLYSSKSDIDVSYFDPHASGTGTTSAFSTLEEATNSSISKTPSNPVIQYGSISNDFSLDLLNRFRTSLPKNSSILLSPASILSLLVTLYRGSSGETDKCMNSILGMDKASMFEACNRSNALIKGLVKYGVNCIYIPTPLPVNMAFQSFAKEVTTVDTYNPEDSVRAVKKINKYVIHKTGSKKVIPAVVDDSIINPKSGVVLVSTSFLKVKFKNTFSETMKAAFGSRAITYLTTYGQTFPYTEDSHHKVVELPLSNTNFSMGIVLPKRQMLPLDGAILTQYATTLKPTFFEMLVIPKFVHRCKYRIENILNDIGFYPLFRRAELPDIVSVNASYAVTSALHQAVFAVSANLAKQSKSKRSGEKFSAHHPFTYYVRHTASNTLVLVGVYN